MSTPERLHALVLWADDKSPNLGVRALARGTAELVRGRWPEAEITFQNYGSRIPQLPIGRLRSLLIERLLGRRGMQDWFRRFDLVIDTRSGDSFTDGYGLRRLAVMTAVGVFAAQAGVPVVLGPQTVGPFTTRRGRALARATLGSASAVLVRDSASARVVAELGDRPCTQTTDVVFTLTAPQRRTSRDVILNVSGLLWNPNPHVDWQLYRDAITSIACTLRSGGRTITLLAHVVRSASADSDIAAARELQSSLGALDPDDGPIELLIPDGLDEVREMLASARVVIASRMHACLNALSVGVPAVSLAYSDKASPLLADLGWSYGVDLRNDPHPVTAALGQLRLAETADVAAVVARAQSARLAGEFALAHLRHEAVRA